MRMEQPKENKIFRVINMAEVYLPRYDEVRDSKGFIKWGENNLYPQYCIELLNKSAKHKAITETKAQMVGGNEWNKTNLSPEAINFIKNKGYKYDLDEVLARISYDLEVHNCFALNIIWTKDRKSIEKIVYLDVATLRVSLDENGEEDGYFVCKDWRYKNKFKQIKVDKFSTTNRDQASQILFVKTYSPGSEYYSVPSYIGANNWIELEWEVSNFHLVETKKGFTPQMIISFIGALPSQEEMDDMVRKTKETYEGTNGEKVIITYSENKDNVPVITPIELNTSDRRFIELNKQITEGIMAGHRVVNPSLFGIKTQGELGGSKDIVDYLNIFTAEYVIPRQKLIEKVFNKLARFNNITDKLEINKFQLKLEVQTSTTDILSVLTAQISDDQKRQVLLTIGLLPEDVDKLVPINNQI